MGREREEGKEGEGRREGGRGKKGEREREGREGEGRREVGKERRREGGRRRKGGRVLSKWLSKYSLKLQVLKKSLKLISSEL